MPGGRATETNRTVPLRAVFRAEAAALSSRKPQDHPPMSCRVRLVLAVHNHQPIGNFDGVFQAAYAESYSPFLDVLEKYPEIPISLHISGSLLEWLADHRPEYIDRVRGLVERGQVEILGGPFYEPILASIPRRDRVGQIVAYSKYLKQLFGQHVRGMWVPERVWEQAFASDIARAGIEYSVLDDFHFKAAGLRGEELDGYYLTEDEGRTLKIFPVHETLRYTIPFRDPEETIDYLREVADRSPGAVCTFGDDGEKFGAWPETHKHCYDDGWLRRFFDALRTAGDWLRVCTLSEAVDAVAPAGTVYLPDSSYREMTEWALPTDRQLAYLRVRKAKENDADWQTLKPFLRGGYWRNFRVKYPESNEMYVRMLDVSRRLEELHQGRPDDDTQDLMHEARIELYRGQCNCPYWHGAFGGLYLPHLRNAIYHHLIAADNLVEKASGRRGRWVDVAAADYNLDGRNEVKLSGDRLVAWLAPSSGGHLYELDIRPIRHNLLATLNRRPEPYHDLIKAAAAGATDHGGIASIHQSVKFKQPNLEKHIAYDAWPRKSLIDHFLQPGLSLEAFRRGEGTASEFATGAYETTLRRSDDRVETVMTRRGRVGSQEVRVTKTIALEAGGGHLEINYLLEDLPAGRPLPLLFAVEFNFAGMAAGAPDRYFYDADGRQLGQLETVLSLESCRRIGLVDEWLGLDAALEISQPAGVWTFPIQTISQSEGGYELVHQSTAVVPHWPITADEHGRWGVAIRLNLDTAAAQARQLREQPVSASK
jgi:alpha-amylase